MNIQNSINSTDSQYSFAVWKYWCHLCQAELRIQVNTYERMEQHCPYCHTVLEQIMGSQQEHPRNYRPFMQTQRIHIVRLSDLLNLFTQPTVIIFEIPNNNENGAPPADESQIQQLRRIKYQNDNIDGEMCYICHEKYKEDELVVDMMCNHKFHEECVVRWLKMHNTCPTCRAQI